MSIVKLDGLRFAQMIIQGANHLHNNSKLIDALNVFPVPDGDTGTNMNLSMKSGAEEVKKLQTENIGQVSKAFANGLLMGARGNSGVILSQLFRGFSKSIEAHSVIDSKIFAGAFSNGVDTAYKAVMKPIEGTILTVAKDAAKKAQEVAKKETDIIVIMEEVLKAAKQSLERTPELLPVLKEVGVVDSGGQGLVTVYEGFLAVLKGESLPKVSIVEPSMDDLVHAEHHKSAQGYMKTEDIEFGYCTEFMVMFDEKKQTFNENAFRNELSEYGDSLLVVSNEDLVKIHIHAEYPGEVMSYAQKYGDLLNIKIENMRQQHTKILEESQSSKENNTKKEPKKEFAIIAVSLGSGIADIFRSMGVAIVIEGGQTMNPSTEDIVKAIEECNAKNIMILPNNGNIVMAAKQAASVVDENVIVIPSKTVPQGMSALLAFNEAQSIEENEEVMNEALAHVKTGQVTYAVRDTKIDDLEIKTGEFMGIFNGKIILTAPDKIKAAQRLLRCIVTEDDEIITVFQGEEALDEDVGEIVNFIEDNFDEIEVDVHKGDQPLYPFIFGVE